MKLNHLVVIASLFFTHLAANDVMTNGDCSATDSSCPDVDCCGTAVPTAGSIKKICFTKSATQWTDEYNNNKVYSFTCPAETVGTGETDGASTLMSGSSAVLLSSALYLLS